MEEPARRPPEGSYKANSQAFTNYLYRLALRVDPTFKPIAGKIQTHQIIQCAESVSQSKTKVSVDPAKLALLDDVIALRARYSEYYKEQYQADPSPQLLEQNNGHLFFIDALQQAHALLSTRIGHSAERSQIQTEKSGKTPKHITNQFAVLSVDQTPEELPLEDVALPVQEQKPLPPAPQLEPADTYKLEVLAYLLRMADLRKELTRTVSDFVAGKTTLDVMLFLNSQMIGLLREDRHGYQSANFTGLVQALGFQASDFNNMEELVSGDSEKSISWSLLFIRGWTISRYIENFAEMLKWELYNAELPVPKWYPDFPDVVHPACAQLLQVVPSILQVLMDEKNNPPDVSKGEVFTIDILDNIEGYRMADDLTQMIYLLVAGLPSHFVQAVAIELYMLQFDALDGDCDVGLKALARCVRADTEKIRDLSNSRFRISLPWEPRVMYSPDAGPDGYPAWQVLGANGKWESPGTVITMPVDLLATFPNMSHSILQYHQMTVKRFAFELLNVQGLSAGMVFIYISLLSVEKVPSWERLDQLLAEQPSFPSPTASMDFTITKLLKAFGATTTQIQTAKAGGALPVVYSGKCKFPTFKSPNAYSDAVDATRALGKDALRGWQSAHHLINQDLEKKDTRMDSDIRYAMQHQKHLQLRDLARALRTTTDRQSADSAFDFIKMVRLILDLLSEVFEETLELSLASDRKDYGIYHEKIRRLLWQVYRCEKDESTGRTTPPELFSTLKPFKNFIEKDNREFPVAAPIEKPGPRPVFQPKLLRDAFKLLDCHEKGRFVATQVKAEDVPKVRSRLSELMVHGMMHSLLYSICTGQQIEQSHS